MEIRNAAIYGIVVLLCVNAFSGMMISAGLEGSPMSPYNDTAVESALNLTETVESSTFETTQFYNIGEGLITWWNKLSIIITGFPQMLSSYGVPSFIYGPINLIWLFLWSTFILLVALAGRNV